MLYAQTLARKYEIDNELTRWSCATICGDCDRQIKLNSGLCFSMSRFTLHEMMLIVLIKNKIKINERTEQIDLKNKRSYLQCSFQKTANFQSYTTAEH